MVGHGGSSAGSYLADPTSPIPSHCASIVATSTLRVKLTFMHLLSAPVHGEYSILSKSLFHYISVHYSKKHTSEVHFHKWSFVHLLPAPVHGEYGIFEHKVVTLVVLEREFLRPENRQEEMNNTYIVYLYLCPTHLPL